MRSVFVFGAMRSGTTSLFHLLSHHEEVSACRVKEPHFYADDIRNDFPYSVVPEAEAVGRLKQDPEAQLHQASIESQDVYDALFPSGGQVRLEASPSYLLSEVASRRIAAEADDPFVLVLLRNPYDRLVSHFELNQRKGESASLDEVVDREIGEGVPLVRKGQIGLVRASCYADDLARLFRDLGPDRVLVSGMERLKSDPGGLCRDVFAAVGLDPEAVSLPEEKVRNRRRPVRSAWVNRVATASGLRRLARAAPEPLRRGLRALYFQDRDSARYHEALERARPVFAEDLGRLADLLGDLSPLPIADWMRTPRL